jgi:hypothetical protein
MGGIAISDGNDNIFQKKKKPFFIIIIFPLKLFFFFLNVKREKQMGGRPP